MKIDITRAFGNQKILILGFGREGMSTYNYLLKHGLSGGVVIADAHVLSELSETAQNIITAHPPQAVYFGADYLSALNSVDMVMLSPGVPPHLPQILAAKNRGVVFTSQTALFLQALSSRTIGVTGTKGKSTTSSLIAHILKTANREVELVGNIERPVFDLVDADTPDKIYVYELSSHQLFGATTSPHIAIFLNFYPEHLDYYPSLKAYFAAKVPITQFQSTTDLFIYNSSDPALVNLAQESKAQSLAFSSIDKLPTGFTTALIGKHNVANVIAAVLALRAAGLSDAEIKNGLSTFKPLKYRLEHIGNFHGIDFYDDALATLPEAAIFALDALAPRVVTLIAGGYERQQDFHAFARKIIECGVKTLILFPPTGSRLEAEVNADGGHISVLTCYHVNTMIEAVKLAYQHTSPGNICLLSAGAPSFGTFKDYKDRSDQYREGVLKLGKNLQINQSTNLQIND